MYAMRLTFVTMSVIYAHSGGKSRAASQYRATPFWPKFYEFRLPGQLLIAIEFQGADA